MQADRRRIRAVVVFLILWPFIMAALSLVLSMAVMAILAFVPAALMAAILLFCTDEVINDWKTEGGRKFIKALMIVIGVELLFGWYLALVPFEKSPQLLPLFFLTVAILALLGKSGFLRFAQLVLTVVLVFAVVVITAVPFGDQKVVTAAQFYGERTIRVPLQPKKWSEPIVPRVGEQWEFLGPPEARVLYEDRGVSWETSLSDFVSLGPSGRFRLQGPAGDTVIVRLTPAQAQ